MLRRLYECNAGSASFFYDRQKFQAPNINSGSSICMKGSSGRKLRMHTSRKARADLHFAWLFELGLGNAGPLVIIASAISRMQCGPWQRMLRATFCGGTDRTADRRLGLGASGARTGGRLSGFGTRPGRGSQSRSCRRCSRSSQLHWRISGDR